MGIATYERREPLWEAADQPWIFPDPPKPPKEPPDPSGRGPSAPPVDEPERINPEPPPPIDPGTLPPVRDPLPA